MENPPDLILAFPSDELLCQDKNQAVAEENVKPEQHKQYDELLANLRSDKHALECEIEQLRAQLAVRNANQFNEQARLIQQRFHDEIRNVLARQTEVVQQAENQMSIYVTNILRKSIESIESLRLLHQKELCALSTTTTDCIHQQSLEMNELCQHLIDAQRIIPSAIFDAPIIVSCQDALKDLNDSFDSKITYLVEIHSSTVDKLMSKHEDAVAEMRCELDLMSSR